ncbi:MAG: hypothetical protein AAGI50_13205, partial [Pseudomonadota bacterium]
ATWDGFLAKAAPGDTILVTFAGHGSNEPAAHPGTEIDGRDETLLLAGFDPRGPGASERIRDDEIAARIAARVDVTHIVVADSCHSGTATRSSPFDLNYRFFAHGELVDDPLPPPPPPPAGEIATGNTVYFGAVSDREKVPEIGIDGQIRGALSYAFADGLRGRADRNDDGQITKGELETHVRRFVKSALAGRQRPQIAPLGRIDQPLFERPRQAPQPEPAFSTPFEALPPLPIVFVGESTGRIDITDFVGVVPAEAQAHRGIIVDFDLREIRTSAGDMLRRLTREVGYDWRDQIQTTIDKMRAVRAIEDSALSGTLDVFLPLGDEVYLEDEAVQILIGGRETPYATVLNLSPNGDIQYLYPLTTPLLDPQGLYDDPVSIGAELPLDFFARIGPPFGAEYVLVIETPEEVDPGLELLHIHNRIRRAAFRFNGQSEIVAFWNEMHIQLADQDYDVGLHVFFTRDQSRTTR